MSTGMPAENWYAPGDGGLGNPVRTPNDTGMYTTPGVAANFIGRGGLSQRDLVFGAVALGAAVLVSEHMRLRHHRR